MDPSNLGADILWKGFRGAGQQNDRRVETFTKPDVLVIHAGSNDLTTPGNKLLKLSHKIKCSLYPYNVLLPNILIIWSSMLPCLYWNGAPLGKGGTKTDLKLWKINKCIKKFITTEIQRTCIIHDANINIRQTGLFRYDGTHLLESGNNA